MSPLNSPSLLGVGLDTNVWVCVMLGVECSVCRHVIKYHTHWSHSMLRQRLGTGAWWSPRARFQVLSPIGWFCWPHVRGVVCILDVGWGHSGFAPYLSCISQPGCPKVRCVHPSKWPFCLRVSMPQKTLAYTHFRNDPCVHEFSNHQKPTFGSKNVKPWFLTPGFYNRRWSWRRVELDLGLCMTLRLAKKMSLRSANFQFLSVFGRFADFESVLF